MREQVEARARRGEHRGDTRRADVCLAQGEQPARQTLVRGIGNKGLWLVVALRRIVEATETGDGPPRLR